MDASDLKKLAAMWLTLPLTALDWWVAWDRLPERVVMKTDAAGHAIHWATRGEAMRFDLVLLGGVLVFMTALSVLGVKTDDERKRHLFFTGLLASAVFVCLVLNGILWIVQVA